MLNGDGNENGNKIKFSRAAHIFGHFFAVVLHDWYISQFQLCLAPLPPPRLLRGSCPPCQSPGWGIANFALHGGRAFAYRAFDTLAVFYQNVTTQRILLEKQAD